ncbi:MULTISPECIES: hypothetical protein [unclassified Streptomyces]|uniref:hypothetical protein n=1 Tax=Streptomyces sp. SS1-1 TaxID=2651869 RepID=UPI00125079CE|nr:hypothetical protein [Streptomyces sp. SS1-1]KAB2974295.1 hypothetical protein F8R89_21280 [Streptomyces sp. SS1-1]
MAGSSSGFVVGLTAAALVAVGLLTFQAAANMPPDLGERPGGSLRAVTSEAARDDRDPEALPALSGTGERVVYALGDDRVWLVGDGDKVKRTFRVTPGSVDPAPGTYTVGSRSSSVTGTDGLPVEHVVRFATVDDVTIGFSAAVPGGTPQPDPTARTGGIRESRGDGTAMWEFATIGRTVVVVP